MSETAKILTVSDSIAAGHAADTAGDALAELLEGAGFAIAARSLIPDGAETVRDALRVLAAGFNGVIVTTGGTGFGRRDLTPEGTLLAIDRQAPGLAEAMRLANPLGRLSRAVAGTIDSALVLNTPGSPRGAVECLAAVLDIASHAIELLRGENPHPHPRDLHAPDDHDH
jgi:molybdopterin adenylyltransferase